MVYPSPQFLRFNTNDGTKVSVTGIKRKKRRYDLRLSLSVDSEDWLTWKVVAGDGGFGQTSGALPEGVL